MSEQPHEIGFVFNVQFMKDPGAVFRNRLVSDAEFGHFSPNPTVS